MTTPLVSLNTLKCVLDKPCVARIYAASPARHGSSTRRRLNDHCPPPQNRSNVAAMHKCVRKAVLLVGFGDVNLSLQRGISTGGVQHIA